MLAITRRDGADIEVAVSGWLTREDYDRFAPAFAAIAREAGPVRILLKLEDFRGWRFQALWPELTFDLRHRKDFRRIAVVGERRWQEWGTWLTRPLFPAPMRYFARDALAEARAWLSSSDARGGRR